MDISHSDLVLCYTVVDFDVRLISIVTGISGCGYKLGFIRYQSNSLNIHPLLAL